MAFIRDIRELLLLSGVVCKDDVSMHSIGENRDGKVLINITGGKGMDVLSTLGRLNYYERMFQLIFFDYNVEAQDDKIEKIEDFLGNFCGDVGGIKINRIELVSGPLSIGMDSNQLQRQSLNFRIMYSKK